MVGRRLMLGTLVLLLVGLPIGVPAVTAARADDLKNTSLELIPADAAFYGTMLRNREQIEIIGRSKAFQALLEMPAVRDGLGMLKAQEGNENSPAGKFQAALKNPMVAELLGLLGDMFSDDVFVYGDAGVVDAIELAQEVGNAVRYGPIVIKVTGKGEDLGPKQRRAASALYALSKNLNLIKVPTIVAGFQVDDTQRAETAITRLETLLTPLTLIAPELNGRLKRQQVGESKFLTLTLDGKMIPWSDVPLDELEELETNDGDAEKVVAKVKDLKLVIALGVLDDHLLLAVTDSVQRLAELGKGDLLVDRPELEPLRKFADERLTGIGYLSEEAARRLAFGPEDVDKLLKLGDVLLPAAKLDEDLDARIRKDAVALAEDVKKCLPRPGAALEFSFLTGEGMESYSYNWTQPKGLDGSQPLGLLDHVGGSPLMALVARGRCSPQDYDSLVHWLKIGCGYLEEFATEKMDPSDLAKYEKLKKSLDPMLEELDEINRQKLIPSLADHQIGLVVDAKLESRQLVEAMPRLPQPMPIIEPALVLGVSDRHLLEEALEGYRDFFDDLVDVIRDIDPNAVPADYSIPWPEVTEIEGKTVIYYDLPDAWGVDEQIVPNLVISDDVAVLTASEAHSRRLLGARSLTVGGLLADTSRPLGAAGLVDWPAVVDAASPWAKLVAREVARKQLKIDDAAAKEAEIESILDQVETVLKVLKTVRGITSQCYIQGDATVTHTLMEVRDIQ